MAERREQREIEPKLHGPPIEILKKAGVAHKLPAITLVLAIEKLLAIGAFVAAGLVIDDPAHALSIDKSAIDARGDNRGAIEGAQGILIAGIGVRPKDPAPVGVV